MKKKIYILLFSLTTILLANSNENAFISNIKELKEISDIMNIIKVNHVGEKKEITNKIMMQGALRGILDSLEDPYSNYFTKEQLKSFKEEMSGKYAGVGMVVQKKVDEPLTVVSPIEDTPAYTAGIRAKDKIIAIDGKSTFKISSEESIKLLKGKEGTTVKLTIVRDGVKKAKTVELKRSIIKLKYVKSRILNKNIGYLRLTQFGDTVSKDVEEHLKSLLNNGAKGIILDLRNNPGGSLGEAVKISSMFIPKGKIVSTKGRNGKEEVENREGKYYGDFPLIVMINEGSASASEIVAGAIKDNKRGVLLGEKSFGKGSVQTLLTLPDGDGIKLTIARYYTPNGTSIHKVGITPDIVVEEKDDVLFFDGYITNVDENVTKDNKNKLIKQVKGEKEGQKLIDKKDEQLERAVAQMRTMMSK